MFGHSIFALALAAVVVADEQHRHTIELVQRIAPEGTLARRLANRAVDIPLLDYYLGTDLQCVPALTNQ
jgi:hypothetical protein